MDRKRVVLILVPLLIFVVALLFYVTSRGESTPDYNSTYWRISILYPMNATEIKGSGTLGISTYTITLTVGFFSGGQLNESNLLAGPIGITEVGNSSIVLKPSKTPKVTIFTQNRTVIVEGDYKSGLMAAVDRFLLMFSGKYAIGLDSSRKYLTVVHPDKGTRYGLPWLGGFTEEEVKRVPVVIYGEDKNVNLMDLILGPMAP